LDYIKTINMQGRKFHLYQLPHNVYSCFDAYMHKRDILKSQAQELKSIVLITDKGLHVIHLPGDKLVNIGAVRKALNAQEVIVPINPNDPKKKSDIRRLDPEDKLSELKIKYGTVCPFLDKIWKLPQLISEDVFEMQTVSTNSGKHDQCIFFDPQYLKDNPNIVCIGELSKS